MNNDLRAGLWHGVRVLGERFVLLQLTLCKTRWLYVTEYIYVREYIYVIILLFLTTEIRDPLPQNASPWRSYGRPSRKAATRIFICINIFIRCARCKLMRESTKETETTSRIRTTALHGRWSRDYQLNGRVIRLYAEWQSATMCYHIIVIDHFIILTYDSLSQMCGTLCMYGVYDLILR